MRAVTSASPVSPGTGLTSPGPARFRAETFDDGPGGPPTARDICWRLALVGKAMAGLWNERALPAVPFLVPIAVAVLSTPVRAQQPAEVMIPMRDGVRLFTVIVAPKNAGPSSPLPILMDRTPYGARDFATDMAQGATSSGLDGYIYVVQDIRGRFGSEGAFDMNRPPHSGHAGTDESTDTYDTIDWLVKNVPNNNGRVGVLGI